MMGRIYYLLTFLLIVTTNSAVAVLEGKAQQPSTQSLLVKKADPTVESIRVMGLVAGRAITDRQVKLDIIIDNPSRVRKEGFDWIGQDELSRGFDRMLTSRMIIEDLRIVGDGVHSLDLVTKNQTQLKKDLGSKLYTQLLEDFELSDQAIREKLSQKIQVERAIEEKIQLALNTRAEKLVDSARDQISKKAIEEWISQLKARYRIQIFRKSE